jgi:urease accessory protein
VLDWLSSGRRERGERWAFRSYSSRLDVHVGDEQVLCESLRLDSSQSPAGGEFKTGGFDCLAVVGLFGEKVVDAVSALLDMISGQPFEPGQEIVEAVSPVPHGAALRVMGSTPELVGRYLDEKLGFLAELIGESPWSRKW